MGATTKIICFHHIPKCAGTALMREFMGAHFNLLEDYRHTGRTPMDDNGFGPIYDVSKMRNTDILCGHFEGPLIGDDNYSIYKRYPILRDKSKSLVFTMLRHPLEMCISMHFYESKRMGIDLSSCHANQNYAELVASIMKRKNYVKDILNIESNSQVPERLSAFSFIGIVEEYDRSLEILARVLSVPKINKPLFANKTQRPSALKSMIKANYSDLLLEHRQSNADYEIYELARGLLNQANS